MQNTLVKSKKNYPSILRSSIFDDFFSAWDKDMESLFFTKDSVPCDLVAIKDADGNIVANEFTYALAGYDKGNVNIEVDDNRLTISVDKSEETSDEDVNKTYLHRGLTRKSQKWSYVLNDTVDANNIKASMDGGLLKVVVPIVESRNKQVKKIEIE